jgi:hypothetical protein
MGPRLQAVDGQDNAALLGQQAPQTPVVGQGNISQITFGQWAKLPRGRGVLDTCKVKYGNLALLDPEEIKVEPETERSRPEAVKVRSKLPGSFDCRVVRQETLDKMPELEKYAEKLLRQWTGASSFKAGRWTVTPTDVAQFLALMLCIKPRPDDSLPVRAVGRLWEEVYLAGDFLRPWNHHRFKTIRDLLSLHGHIDWVDFRFQNLPESKGRCCRWQLSFMLRSTLSSFMGGQRLWTLPHLCRTATMSFTHPSGSILSWTGNFAGGPRRKTWSRCCLRPDEAEKWGNRQVRP